MFETVEEAAETLFPAANKIKLSRIRAIARAVEAMTVSVSEPESWSLRQCLRIASAVRAGFAPVMRAALEVDLDAPADAQWRMILPYLEESEAIPEEAKPVGPRSRRLIRPRYGVALRREKTAHGWALHMTGLEASDMLTDRVFDEIEMLLAPLTE